MAYYKNVGILGYQAGGVSYNQIMEASRATVNTEPVTLSELKDFAKISGSSEDAILTALITTARDMCERYCNINFVQRQVIATINNSNGGTYLPYGPIGTVTAATDLDGETILADSTIIGTEWKQFMMPYGEIIVTYSGGYATCPEHFKTAIKCQALFLYENRGDSQEAFSPIAKTILDPYKRV